MSVPLQGTYTVTSNTFNTSGSVLNKGFITFLTDGTYIIGVHTNNSSCPNNGNGVERGTYTWKPVGNTGSLSMTASLEQLGDSNTGCGFAPTSADQTLTKNADGSITFNGDGGTIVAAPVTFHAGTPIQGAFNVGNSGTTYNPPSTTNGSALIVFIDSSHYFLIENAGATDDPDDLPLIEDACYTLNASNQFAVNFSSSCTTAGGEAPIHTTGDGGLMGNTSGGASLVVSKPETSTQLETLTFTISSEQTTATHIPTR